MRWILALLVAASLAGCAEAPEEDDGHTHHEGHAMHMMQNVTFFEQPALVEDAISGSFAPQDDGQIQALFFTAGQPASNFHQHDISDLIPDGVPAFVEFEVVAGQATYVGLGASDFESVWTSDCNECIGGGVGTTWSGAVMDDGGDFLVNVVNTGQTIPSQIDYEVAIRITADPQRLPSGVVVEVEMPNVGSHILFESVEGDVPDVMVFDPDDVYLTTLEGGNTAEMYIEDGMATGAYVFLPVGHGSFYRLRSGADIAEGETLDVQARILDQIIQTGGAQPAGDSGSYEVVMDVQPLQHGILVFGGLNNGAEIRSSGPEGFVMEANAQGPGFGFGAFTQTPMGHDALRAGTYTISWETPNNGGSAQVQEFFTLYGR